MFCYINNMSGKTGLCRDVVAKKASDFTSGGAEAENSGGDRGQSPKWSLQKSIGLAWCQSLNDNRQLSNSVEPT